MPVKTPRPPYFAVIFEAKMTGVDFAEYITQAEYLLNKAHSLPGFYGEDAIRAEDGCIISISYWRSEADIKEWLNDFEHSKTRKLGRELWYERFIVRVGKVTRDYEFLKKHD